MVRSERAYGAFLPFVLLLACVLLHGGCTGCTCVTSEAPPRRESPLACVPQHPTRLTLPRGAPEIETVSAGSLPGTFSMTSTGEARFVLPLRAPPGRGNVAPSLAVAFNSSGGDGVLGAGFSLTGASSSITRCPKNLAQDGEIRSVRYDGEDKLCLDGKPLVIIEKEPDHIEYRTVPDTFAKVIGHDPGHEGTPRSFEVFAPSGLVVEYGTDDGSRPLGPGGVPRAWLAAVAHDGRGNAMTYGYCFAEAEDYTAEFALDEIRYTSFDGCTPALRRLPGGQARVRDQGAGRRPHDLLGRHGAPELAAAGRDPDGRSRGGAGPKLCVHVCAQPDHEPDALDPGRGMRGRRGLQAAHALSIPAARRRASRTGRTTGIASPTSSKSSPIARWTSTMTGSPTSCCRTPTRR